MKVTKITIGRLFNLVNYEHVRYEIAVEVPEGESAATAITGLEHILAALSPKRPSGIPTEQSLCEAEQSLIRLRASTDEQFKSEQWRYEAMDKGLAIEFCEKQYQEGKVRFEKFEARQLKARKMLDDLGGAANWKDAKLSWDEGDTEF